MTGPTDIEIERAIEALNNNHWHIVADMMLALKARAKATEKERDNLGDSLRNYAALERIANERAEAAEKERDYFAKLYAEEGHAKMVLMEESNERLARAEAAEKERDELKATLELQRTLDDAAKDETDLCSRYWPKH